MQSKEQTMKGHSDSVDQLCWHPTNGNLLVTASGDRTVRVWDARGMVFTGWSKSLVDYENTFLS